MTERTSSNGSNEVILTLKDIQKRFGGIHALAGVSFDLRRGEVHALCGENGAGKSTLLGLLAGLDEPSEGEVWLAGTEITALDEDGRGKCHRKVAAVEGELHQRALEVAHEEDLRERLDRLCPLSYP